MLRGLETQGSGGAPQPAEAHVKAEVEAETVADANAKGRGTSKGSRDFLNRFKKVATEQFWPEDGNFVWDSDGHAHDRSP